MIFSSITFLFYFLPIVIVIYYIIPNKFKNTILLISSLVFYSYGEPKYVFLMIFSIIISYIFGILINKYKKYSKLFLIISICIVLALLIYFKYINFILENINLFLSNRINLIQVVLPIGISFYTFQIISYLVDIYKERIEAQKNIFKLATYISLFPQLIAGPIVKYSDIEEQLEKREYSFEKFSLGVRRFIIGLGKKVLIADTLGKLNSIILVNTNDCLAYWLYAISGMLQIYFDFSGYSDMAIGLGKMFGFNLLENFNYPYTATSITDFWRRWHISLSSWFKDYIYIPLGGNRKGKITWFRNILIVWILTGLWHGASWNFIIWGLYFAILLILEKTILKKLLEKVPKILARIYTLLIVMISFIIFNSENISVIEKNIKGLFGIGYTALISQESLYYFKSYIFIIVISTIASMPIFKNIFKIEKNNKIINFIEPIFLLLILILSTSYIIDGSFSPFLYFRF